MVIKDYYKILGFENNKVSLDEIKNAYREMAKKYHPDLNGNNNKAEERFKDIGEAYNTLSNSKQRRKYDRLWYYYIGRKNKQNKNYRDAKIKDFMELFFGEKKEKEENKKSKNEPEKGEDIYTEINATVIEAYFGAIKQIEFRTVKGGSKKLDVKIPSGIRNEEKIRVIGQGKNGKNGGKNGDLFIKIKIKDTPTLKLRGIDLYTDLLITPWESALSEKVSIQGIDEEHLIDIPKGIQSGEEIIIKGKGYRDGKGGRGDLIAQVKIMMPKQVSQEEINLLKRLREVSKFNPRKIKSV